MAVPWEGLEVADRVFPEYTVHALNGPPGFSDREGVTVETCFVGAGQRKHPGLKYVPSRLSMVPLLFDAALPPDIVLLHTSLPQDGHVSLGIEVNILPAAIEACRARGGLVVAVMNARMPFTYGDAMVPLEHVRYAVEIDRPLPAGHANTIDEASAAIGDRVASMVPDGATLQLGIGAVPDATLAGLTGKRDLRVWTEMFSDGVLALDRLDHNTRVQFKRTETTNDPALIARQRFMQSINTALEVDLFGQANASRINARIYSGFGGQTDFIVGALHSRGGQSFMALRSWHPKANVSTIVPLIDEPVTSFQQSMVVTENGAAHLWGRDEKTQARELIESAAHPQVREELWEEAHILGLA